MTHFFPILTRTYRTQFRQRNFLALLFALSALFAGFLLWRYAAESVSYIGSTLSVQARLQRVGQEVWLQLAWLQTAVALLISPALSAGTIARERERGLLDGLILAPLAPARIVLEKGLSALAPVALMFAVLMPFDIVALLLGGQGVKLGAVLGFQLLLAAASAAIGLGCSAWARRAHLASRSAYGFLILWILGSGGAAFLAGDSFLGRLLPAYIAPFYIVWLGHTNPLLGAYDLIMPDATGNYWLGATLTLAGLLVLAAWSAMRAVRQPLVEAPFIADTQKAAARKKRAQGSGVPEHFEVPFVGALRFANPVLGREVRSKFRLRQPPMGVILVEIVLALAVAYFYGLMLWTALTDPSTRGIIFYGVAITSLIVTLISCAIMGANGFSREHEGGTWESLRLSMLRPREIVRGKALGIMLTCLLFSVAVWPLLLPCVNWSESWQKVGSGDEIAVSQLAALTFVWLGCIVVATMLGLALGRRTRATSAASGIALGACALWLIGLPLMLVFSGTIGGTETMLAWLHPFFALFETNSYWYGDASALALPFVAAALAVGALLWALLERDLKRDFGRNTRPIAR